MNLARSSTSLHTHTHRMWGNIGSRGQAADRGSRGATNHDRKRVNRGSTGTCAGTLRKRCARLQAQGYRTPSELLSLGLMATLEGSYLAKSRTRPCLDTCTHRLDPHPPPPLLSCIPTEDLMPFRRPHCKGFVTFFKVVYEHHITTGINSLRVLI